MNCEICGKPVRFWQNAKTDYKLIDSPVDSNRALKVEIKYHWDCFKNKFWPQLKDE